MTALSMGCSDTASKRKAREQAEPLIDLDSIRRRGSLIMLTENSASTYYLYRNEARGFDYELAAAFAKSLGLKLEVKLIDDVDRMLELLLLGEADLAASNLTITPSRLQQVAFSQPLYATRQVLVQRQIEESAGTTGLAIRDTNELHLLPIWVHRYSSFYEQLEKIRMNSGMPLHIEEAPGEISTDDLIRLVDDGAIPATITDENLAAMELGDYPNVDMSIAISDAQDIAWAVRKSSPKLLRALNDWLGQKDVKTRREKTYAKYFTDEPLERPGGFTLPKVQPGNISAYDSLFRKFAPRLGWDWQMLASIAYHESHFNPNAHSWSGAYGLMQLMPQTAKRFGCTGTPTPECSVEAAVKYLQYLMKMWEPRVPNPQERTKFVLASYNIGQGHVIDAQNLARELGMRDTLWDGEVAEALLLKQQEKYYTMACVKHGYCRAKEPFIFVEKIIGTYELYKTVSNP
jgi:membrane-bound lytic murein transglycosylase F